MTQMAQTKAIDRGSQICDSREPTAGQRPAVCVSDSVPIERAICSQGSFNRDTVTHASGFQPLGSPHIREICGCLFDRHQTP